MAKDCCETSSLQDIKTPRHQDIKPQGPDVLTSRRLDVPSILICILIRILTLIGAALRVGGIATPLTHDELSAICRLQYDTLSDVLAYGVMPDGHPGGVQLFMWLWSRLFGTSAVAIRLPFMLMGIATVPLIYAIGRRCFGRWSALLPAAVLAVSQYTVYYSDLARPYSAGIFFILCALNMLTLMVKEQRYTLPRLALFALFEACCAYTHYFCALTAALMACTALFFVGKRHLLPYLAACVAAVLLFLPHLPITLHQLFELKGIGGWLGKPTPAFASEYLRYLNHHSLLAAIVALVAYALVFSPKAFRRNVPLMAAMLAVGLLPAIIGYVYSVTVNPVLQFSVLIFSFPFLLLALAAGVDDTCQRWRVTVATAAYTVVMVVTLFVTRHHFTMMRHEWVEAMVNEAQKAVNQYGSDNVACLFNLTPDKVAYYDSTLHPMPQELLDDAARLDSALGHCTMPYIVCSGIQDPAMLAIVGHHYPTLLRVRPCVVSEVCLFGRQPSASAINLDQLATAVFERSIQTSTAEYQTILDTILSDITDSRFVCIESRINLAGESPAYQGSEPPVYLATELVRGGRKLDWRGISILPTTSDSLATIVLPVRVESIVKHHSQLKRTRVTIYLWNPGGENREQHHLDCRIRILPTSPWMYSVLEEI